MNPVFYSGRAAGLRQAIETLDMLCDRGRGYRFGAKALAERAKILFRNAIEEEQPLTASQPAAGQP